MTTTPTSGAADLPEALRQKFEAWLPKSWSRDTVVDDDDGDTMYVDDWVQGAYVGYCAALTAQAISAEPAGAGYAALPDAKTLGEAVAAWIGVETRGARNWVDTTVDRLGFAVRSVMGDMLRASHGQAPAGAAPAPVLHLVNSAFAEVAMAFPEAFALHKVGIADTAVREALAAPAPPPECETEAEKRAFAFGWFKAQEAERMKTESVQEDAARWREHVGKLDALVAYCPTCCQGFIAKQDMTRDEVLFACGKAVGQSGAKRLREALDLAVDHIDMDALRISHCKDAAAIDEARKQGGAT